MAFNNSTLMKLQNALNANGDNIMINQNQFYSPNLMRPINMWHVKRAMRDADSDRYYYVELFRSASKIQVALFLRDLWYEQNGWEVPTDNEMWNNLKKQRAEKELE